MNRLIKLFPFKTHHLITGILLLIIIGCSTKDRDRDSNQKYNVAQSVKSMDKNGTSVSYKVKYDIIAKTALSNVEIDEIQLKTKWVVSDVLEFFTYEDCLFKRDSVETIIIREVLMKNKTDYTHLESLIIEEVAILEQILELIVARHGEFKDKNIVGQ
jgi:hypothetical protein